MYNWDTINLHIRKAFESLFKVDRNERLKLLLLSVSFFFIIGGYTIIKELKDSVFLNIVGDDYVPAAKIISMIVLIPAILFYSFLVDKIRRYHLLYVYSILYGILGLIFTYYLGDPVIGIANTESNPSRIFGWLFYFFVEGFSPFIVSVFWAFSNSITSPEAAKKNYGFMVSGSKLGGMITSFFAWKLFSCEKAYSKIIFTPISKHQILLASASILLLFIPMLIHLLMKKVPGRFLHGYEAVYRAEKEKIVELKEDKEKKQLSSSGLMGYILSKLPPGLLMIIQQPYVLGIYGIIFFYELINVVLSYQRILLAKKASQNISELNCLLFEQVFMIHFFGFVISILGTNTLLRKFGERKCLLLVPTITGIFLFIFSFYKALNIATVFIVLRTLNYAFGYPLRESLYIPTIKDIKFKSKSWIDTFGSKFARGLGSVYNIGAKMTFNTFGISMFIGLQSLFFSITIGFWIFTAYMLGKRYDKAIKKNEVIGLN